MQHIEVKNIEGTSDNYPPSQYTSWLEFWKDKKNNSSPKCSCIRCPNKAVVGGHVLKENNSDKNWYIVPLCSVHNNTYRKEPFFINQDDMILANKSMY